MPSHPFTLMTPEAHTMTYRSGVKPGQWIVIPGAGGGVGHLAVQYAHAMGMRVVAIDTGERKRQLCAELGANVFIDFKTTADTAAEVQKLTEHGAHGVLVIAPSKEAFATAPSFLRAKGTVVVVGLPKDTSILVSVPPIQLTQMELRVVGSFAADKKEVEEAFDLSVRGLVRVSRIHAHVEKKHY
jgi:propanol-preferring alcohol dehydrogenase